jgi:hypothetical protein
MKKKKEIGMILLERNTRALPCVDHCKEMVRNEEILSVNHLMSSMITSPSVLHDHFT